MPRFAAILLIIAATVFAAPAHAQKNLPPELKQEWTETLKATSEDKIHFAEKLYELGHSRDSLRFIEKVARKGHEPTQMALRNLLEKFVAGNDDPYLKFKLGQLLLWGKLGKKDPKRAEALLTAAADAGIIGAQYELGTAYSYGKRGMPKDSKKGIAFLSKAADAGDTLAMSLAGRLVATSRSPVHDPVNGEKWLSGAAAKGDTKAAFELGRNLYYGGNGFPQDQERAEKLFVDSLREGDAEYLLKVADVYAIGAESRNEKYEDNNYKTAKWAYAYVAYKLKSAPLLTPDENEKIKVLINAQFVMTLTNARSHLPAEKIKQSTEEAIELLNSVDALSLEKLRADHEKRMAGQKAAAAEEGNTEEAAEETEAKSGDKKE